MSLSNYTRRALLGGGISLAVLAIGTFVLGNLSGYEAKVLIKNSISGLNTLCNTIVLASATILALMLTLLGFSSKTSSTLEKDHYRYIMQIARFDTIIFVVALLFFVLFNLPVAESDSIPENWFTVIYYITLGISALLSASLIVVVLMLYNTIVNIIKIVGLGMKDHPLAKGDEESEA